MCNLHRIAIHGCVNKCRKHIGCLSKTDRTYRTSIGTYRKSIGTLSNIYQKSIDYLSAIYRKSIQHLSKFYRTSIEHLSESIEHPSNIYWKSIKKLSEIYRQSIGNLLSIYLKSIENLSIIHTKHKNGSIPSHVAWNQEFLRRAIDLFKLYRLQYTRRPETPI